MAGAVIGFLLTVGAASLLVDHWVFYEIGQRLKMEIGGTVRPAYFVPAFEVTDLKVHWKGEAKVTSGTLRVSYSIRDWLRGGSLRVQISGKDLNVSFSGNFPGLEGVAETVIEKFFADFKLSGKGISDILTLHLQSPDIEFHIDQRSGQQ